MSIGILLTGCLFFNGCGSSSSDNNSDTNETKKEYYKFRGVNLLSPPNENWDVGETENGDTIYYFKDKDFSRAVALIRDNKVVKLIYEKDIKDDTDGEKSKSIYNEYKKDLENELGKGKEIDVCIGDYICNLENFAYSLLEGKRFLMNIFTKSNKDIIAIQVSPFSIFDTKFSLGYETKEFKK